MKVSFDSEYSADCEISNLRPLHYFPEMLASVQKTLKSEEALRNTDISFSDAKNRDGPSVNKDCQYCGNDRMTYVTMQSRSADEGQTVIYTCTQCKKKEVENTW